MDAHPYGEKGAHDSEGDNGFLTLSFADQFLIWSTRIWVAATAPGRRVPAILQEGLCAAGVPEAGESLDALLWLMCRHALQPPDFHGVRCLCVGRDERMLIRAVAAAQHGDSAAARRHLETLLPAEMAAAAAPRLHEIGHIFLCAGLRLGVAPCGTKRALSSRFAVRPGVVVAAGSRSVH